MTNVRRHGRRHKRRKPRHMYEYNEDLVGTEHGLFAYGFALSKNHLQLTFCANLLIDDNIEQAMEDALNPKYQRLNPLYCAKLANLLADGFSGDAELIYWYRIAAYNYALAKEHNSLIFCAQKIINISIAQVMDDALNEEYQNKNPLYCAHLSNLLANYSAGCEHCFKWCNNAAYFYALAGDQQRLINCTESFVKANMNEAIKIANNQDFKSENPLYYDELHKCINMVKGSLAPTTVPSPILFSNNMTDATANEYAWERVNSMPCLELIRDEKTSRARSRSI